MSILSVDGSIADDDSKLPPPSIVDRPRRKTNLSAYKTYKAMRIKACLSVFNYLVMLY